MQNDEIKKNKIIKNWGKKNESTRLTCHSWHEIGIKKLGFQKNDLAKRLKLKALSEKMQANPD
jgi:hypothetical protein